MQIYSSIQQALLDSECTHFVISENEVHAFDNIKEATGDHDEATERGISTMIINREEAEKTYL